MITKKLAKAILKSPNFGELHDSDDIAWVKRTVFTWPLCQAKTKIDIYVNDERVMRCDLSWIRKYANS